MGLNRIFFVEKESLLYINGRAVSRTKTAYNVVDLPGSNQNMRNLSKNLDALTEPSPETRARCFYEDSMYLKYNFRGAFRDSLNEEQRKKSRDRTHGKKIDIRLAFCLTNSMWG